MKRVKTKQKASKKYEVTQKQMDKVIINATSTGVKSAIAIVLAAVHDVLGLDDEQARTISDRVHRYCNYVWERKTVSGEYITKHLKRDGIELRYVISEKDDEEDNVLQEM